MLGLVVGSALMFRLGPYVVLPEEFHRVLRYGTHQVSAPVKIGDTIHCEVKVKSLTVKDEKAAFLRMNR